jgi:hypothetical protein
VEVLIKQERPDTGGNRNFFPQKVTNPLFQHVYTGLNFFLQEFPPAGFSTSSSLKTRLFLKHPSIVCQKPIHTYRFIAETSASERERERAGDAKRQEKLIWDSQDRISAKSVDLSSSSLFHNFVLAAMSQTLSIAFINCESTIYFSY